TGERGRRRYRPAADRTPTGRAARQRLTEHPTKRFPPGIVGWPAAGGATVRTAPPPTASECGELRRLRRKGCRMPETTSETTEPAASFSTRIREATAREHEEAENSTFISEMLAGALGIDSYRRYTEQLWFIYRALEAH